jgi:hypothetical protein
MYYGVNNNTTSPGVGIKKLENTGGGLGEWALLKLNIIFN